MESYITNGILQSSLISYHRIFNTINVTDTILVDKERLTLPEHLSSVQDFMCSVFDHFWLFYDLRILSILNIGTFCIFK